MTQKLGGRQNELKIRDQNAGFRHKKSRKRSVWSEAGAEGFLGPLVVALPDLNKETSGVRPGATKGWEGGILLARTGERNRRIDKGEGLGREKNALREYGKGLTEPKQGYKKGEWIRERET